MSIELATGLSGTALLRDQSFTDRWQELYSACPWATPFQSPLFVHAWFDVYKGRFEPLILYRLGPGEVLDGLLVLASASDSGGIEVAGCDRAEYQVWLARDDHAFIGDALARLREFRPGTTLVFQYLPPRTPTAWIADQPVWKKLCGLEASETPIMRIGGGGAVSASRRRKTARSIARLEKTAATRFERLRTVDELTSVIDHIAVQYDFRQAAVNNYLHFRADPLRKAFQLALMRAPGLLHATVLRHGGVPIAANLGISGKGTVHLGVFSHSVAFAKESPGKLLLVLLSDHLGETGWETLDLTPGDNAYKRDFANDAEIVHRLTVFPRRSARRHAAIRDSLVGVVKRAVRAAGGDPPALRRQMERARRAGLRRALSRGLSWLLDILWSRREARVYAIRVDHVRGSDARAVVRRDVLEDLLAFESLPGWSTREEFLSRALTRLQNGHHVYTRVEDGRLVHYGWMAEMQDRADLHEVGQAIALPPRSATFYEYFTHPSARGRGLYQRSVHEMLREAAAAPHIEWIFIWVLAGNAASRHVIEKCGFEYRGSAFQRTVVGLTRRWSTFDAAATKDTPLGEPVSRGVL
jgi:CelD/BcsL family acetyltransferase involved in cellulose biosynthesis/RimJ/RimL family protein N-acetyltransferase